MFGLTLLDNGSYDVMIVNSGVPEDFAFRQMRAHLRMLDDNYTTDYRKRNRR